MSEFLEQFRLVGVQLKLLANLFSEHAHAHQLVPLLLSDPLFFRLHLVSEVFVFGLQFLFTLNYRSLELDVFLG